MRQATNDTALMIAAVTRRIPRVERRHVEQDILHGFSGKPCPQQTEKSSRDEKPQA